MTRDQELAAKLAAGAALGVALLYHEEIIATTKDVITRGARLTQTKLAGLVIPDDPDELAAAAEQVLGQSLAYGPYSSLDVYALIRMARSEAGARDNDISRKVRMHVAINDFEALGWQHLSSLFLYSTHPDSKGLFGSQEDGRRFATTRDPYAGDFLLAKEVIDERAQGVDLADGARKFVDRKSMGRQHGSGSWENLVARWGNEGLEPEQLTLPGLPDDFYVFVHRA